MKELIICALGWSLAGVFMKFVTINSFAMAGFRSLIAFIAIVAITRSFPRFFIKGDKKRTIYLWASALSYAGTMILFCFANKLTYSANAVFLQYTTPAWIIILGPFLIGEKNTKRDFLSVGGVIIGMLLFFADSLFGKSNGEFAETEVLGNILALLSGVTYCLTTIYQRKQQMETKAAHDSHNYSQDAFMLAQIIVAVFGLPFVFILENGVPDFCSSVFLLLLGIFQMAIPNITYAIGIGKVRALSASLITMIEPLMNPVWVLIFVGELPGWTCIVGGILIIGCILAREIANQNK